jgi:NhaP-type Na+/H+ or K+/H+ antiporter
LIVIIGRYVAIFVSFWLFNQFFRSRTISPQELIFIGWGGMIRGAVAFALVMEIPHIGDHHSCPTNSREECFSKNNYEMIVTTTLVLVIFTTLFFGTFMQMLGNYIVPPRVSDLPEHDGHHVDDKSFHHIIVHPNEVSDLSVTMF